MKTKQLREGDLLFYSFSRAAVEAGDFRHFLDTFGLENLPRDQALRPLCNSIVFILDGYDEDTRELYEIPHVRQFCTSSPRKPAIGSGSHGQQCTPPTHWPKWPILISGELTRRESVQPTWALACQTRRSCRRTASNPSRSEERRVGKECRS